VSRFVSHFEDFAFLNFDLTQAERYIFRLFSTSILVVATFCDTLLDLMVFLVALIKKKYNIIPFLSCFYSFKWNSVDQSLNLKTDDLILCDFRQSNFMKMRFLFNIVQYQ